MTERDKILIILDEENHKGDEVKINTNAEVRKNQDIYHEQD